MARRHRRRDRVHYRPDPMVAMTPELYHARQEYTDALQAWIAAKGEDEPSARARLQAARAAVTAARAKSDGKPRGA